MNQKNVRDIFQTYADQGFARIAVEILQSMPQNFQHLVLQNNEVLNTCLKEFPEELATMITNMPSPMQADILAMPYALKKLSNKENRQNFFSIIKNMSDDEFVKVAIGSEGFKGLSRILLKDQAIAFKNKIQNLSFENQTAIFSADNALENLWGIFQGNHIDLIEKLPNENQFKIYMAKGAVLNLMGGFMNSEQREKAVDILNSFSLEESHQILNAERFTEMHLRDKISSVQNPKSYHKGIEKFLSNIDKYAHEIS